MLGLAPATDALTFLRREDLRNGEADGPVNPTRVHDRWRSPCRAITGSLEHDAQEDDRRADAPMQNGGERPIDIRGRMAKLTAGQVGELITGLRRIKSAGR